MPIKKKIQDEAEKYIARSLIGFVPLALLLAMAFAGTILPPALLHLLGSRLIAQILLALILIVIFLIAWIIRLHRRPVREFLPNIGVWKDKKTGIYGCAKCSGPLQTQEAGWYCVSCHLLYDNPEFKAKRDLENKARREREDARVREFNNSRRI